MMHSRSILIVLTISLGAAACSAPAVAPATPPPQPPATSPSVAPPQPTVDVSPTASPTAQPPVTDPPAAPEPPPTEPTTAGVDELVTYDWAVPSGRVSIPQSVQVPIAPSPALPLPSLVAIYVGDHLEPPPGYQRMSFYFRGAYPAYDFGYVRAVVAEGSGAPISLEGNSFLRVGFTNAQAHDNAGESTVMVAPNASLDLMNLKSYGLAGDFEGQVTYGLGLQVAPDSDQILEIRTGELKRPDGAGGFWYVVYVDMMTGGWG